ncbi:MAG TPA: diphthine synthase [Candidatus Sulfotelmatobacter sp.]|nr:diphthine synthase [Candidatus Sulfotelmatobacter sp.]
MSVAFIGLGLNDERGLTVEGLEEARHANSVFAEFYTNTMPGLDRKKLELLVGKKVVVLNRIQLEDEEAKPIVEAAERGKVAFLVPGDPMIATTHISIRLELARRGIPSRILHGPSVMSAVCGATGLQSYKFGKSVTLPREPGVPGSLLDTVRDNKKRGLHTLILLDIRPEMPEQLTIREAAAKMVIADPTLGNWMGVGVARIGSGDEFVVSAKLGKLQNQDFGRIPHCLVLPGRLHFMEVEALKAFCGAEDADLEALK